MEDQRSCPEAGNNDPEHKRSIPIVVVSGLASGTGKTSAAEAVIMVLREQGTSTAAVKVTVTHSDRGCPHGGRSCNVCGGLGEDFDVISSPSVTKQPNTDTGRFHSRGADPVLWLITRRPFALDGWNRVERYIENAGAIVIESNTLADAVKADLLIMVADPTANRRLWKDSARNLLTKADLIVVNERGNNQQIVKFYAELERLRGPSARVIGVTHPFDLERNGLFRELLERRGLLHRRHADLSTVT